MPHNILRIRYILLSLSIVMTIFFGCQSPEDVFDAGNGSDTLPPTVPGGLSASEITDSSITISWEASGDNVAVKAYILFQDKVQISTDSLTRQNIAGLLPQTIYTYTVRAVDRAGNLSKLSPQITATTLKKETATDSIERDTIAPTAPKNLTATDTTLTSAVLNWNAATDGVGVTAYRVYQDTVLLASVPDTTYLVTNLTSDVEYNFSVSAIDAAENESTFSNVVALMTMTESTVLRDTVPPPQPTNLSVSDSTQTSVDLIWQMVTDSVGPVTYRVYQDSTIIGTIAESQYKVTDLLSATEYIFFVSAIDSLENESALSNSVTVTTEIMEVVENDTIPPTVPTNLVANEIMQTTVDLSWDAATDSVGVANYNIYQNGEVIATVGETNYQATELEGGISYDFAVSAIDTAENESAPSATLVVTTIDAELDTVAPSVPVNVVANEVTQTTTNLSWDVSKDDSGVANYTVFQNGSTIATVVETNYQVTGLAAGVSYDFTVSAIDTAENESAPSATLVVTTEAESDTVPPTVPVNVVANEITQTTVDLSWAISTDDSGVANYTVFQDGSAIATIAEANYQVTGLSAGTSYNFTVSAADTAMNESGLSEAVSVTTLEAQSQIDRVLVFTKTAAFRHGSIEKGFATLSALGSANDFEVVQTENSGDFNTSNLQRYKLVVFLNTTGDVLNSAQQSAFENYIRSGGSYMGIHAATDTEYDWPWYGQLVGAYFNGHPNIQQATVNLVEQNHPSTSHLPNAWQRTDEWYNFRNINPSIIPLLNLDDNSYSGGTNGSNHPIAWYHEFDGGKSFYTGGGHSNSAYDEHDFRQHLLGGIEYCLGR